MLTFVEAGKLSLDRLAKALVESAPELTSRSGAESVVLIVEADQDRVKRIFQGHGLECGAVALRPDIYVLDDSFSALDAATDARLRSSLQHEMKGSTVVVVAQRISTVLHADRIVVLDAGRIVDVGTHAQLVARGGLYAKLASMQFAPDTAPDRSTVTASNP